MHSSNKKGQAVFVGIMVFIMVFITVSSLIPVLKPEYERVRGVGYLDCTNTSISTATKALCIVVDWSFFYFVAVAIGAGIAYITGRKLGLI